MKLIVINIPSADAPHNQCNDAEYDENNQQNYEQYSPPRYLVVTIVAHRSAV